jgi:hypothetical protein
VQAAKKQSAALGFSSSMYCIHSKIEAMSGFSFLHSSQKIQIKNGSEAHALHDNLIA